MDPWSRSREPYQTVGRLPEPDTDGHNLPVYFILALYCIVAVNLGASWIHGAGPESPNQTFRRLPELDIDDHTLPVYCIVL